MHQELSKKCQWLRNKRGYLISLFIIIYFLTVNSFSSFAAIPTLRVGIFLDYKEVELKGEKGLQIYELPAMKKLFEHDNNKSIKIKASLNGININNQLFPSVNEIKIIPGNGGFIQVNDRKYRGEIEVILNHSILNVINVIELEKYLYGVLKKEVSPEWPEETLKAQAIASRTFALSNLNKFIDKGYNICATTNSQAYGGIYHEDPATNKAVNDTRGIIAVYQDEPINAVYHSDCGGYTENSEDVWGAYVPYLRSVSSDYEGLVSPPNHVWEYSMSKQEILEILNQKDMKINDIKDILVNEKTDTGRVKSIEIIGNQNNKLKLKTNDFRLLIGPTFIRSSLFTINVIRVIENKIEEKKPVKDILENSQTESKPVEKSVKQILQEDRDFSISELLDLLKRSEKEEKNDVISSTVPDNIDNNAEVKFIFNGQGNGHGVGLSQWGAYGMALKGFNYEEILKYYYQGIQLKKLY